MFNNAHTPVASPGSRDASASGATMRDAPVWYRTIWRWHFYAGLLCVPFVIWLALTGSIYLWRPQIESWLDRSYDHLAIRGLAASPETVVAAAREAVPGSTLHRYFLPETAHEAVRVLVSRGGEDWRVYVDPYDLAILGSVREERRPMRLIFHLHGELLAGAPGSYLVEAAACWTIVMLLTGLYLWWPRGARGFAGVLYPRLRLGSRILWRDLHATSGVWVSTFALILILTGLPWAKGWGSYLNEIRFLTGASRGTVDWTIGGKPPKQDPMIGDHQSHGGMAMPPVPFAAGELTRVVAGARKLGIAPPVLVTPPHRHRAPWHVSSDAADRPLRSDAEIDGATGAVIGQVAFAQRHWIDRAVGYGVAVHEGVLFGLANQIGGSMTALLLVVLAVSGVTMWWRRRPAGLLGAPVSLGSRRMGAALAALIVLLAVYMPLFGASLLLVLCLERLVLRRLPPVRDWLGLQPAHAQRMAN